MDNAIDIYFSTNPFNINIYLNRQLTTCSIEAVYEFVSRSYHACGLMHHMRCMTVTSFFEFLNSFVINFRLQAMTTYQIDLLNPKAGKLLQDLADLKLIAIRPAPIDGFLDTVNRLRTKAATQPPTLGEITKEVEAVRIKRYAKNKA